MMLFVDDIVVYDDVDADDVVLVELLVVRVKRDVDK